MVNNRPTVYKASSVYKEAGGGFNPEFGGIEGKLLIATDNKANYLNGVAIGSKYYYASVNGTHKQRWCLTKKTPVDISTFKKIVWKFGFYFVTPADGYAQFNSLFGANYTTAFIDTQMNSAYDFKVMMKKSNGSIINTYTVGTLQMWKDYVLEFILDKDNGKIIINLNGENKINSSFDFSQIDTTSFIPGYGVYYNQTTPLLNDGVRISREMTLTVDGVEQFDTL